VPFVLDVLFQAERTFLLYTPQSAQEFHAHLPSQKDTGTVWRAVPGRAQSFCIKPQLTALGYCKGSCRVMFALDVLFQEERTALFFLPPREEMTIYKSGSCQSIAGRPAACKAELVLEKCRQPKNPREAESGEGCGAFSTVWRSRSIHSALRWA
jgi:hypothetical protein